MNRSLACLALVLVAGCPQPMEPMDDDVPTTADGGVDGGTEDVPVSPDVPDDDADDDGIPAASDCDDMDSAVGSSGSRSCAGPCGDGVEACIAGEWQGCMASTDCLCPTNGMMRTVPCGTMCGTRTDTCVDLHWVEGATCDGEGECAAGAIETTEGERCLVTRRVCGAACVWGPVETVTPMGRCTPGLRFCPDRLVCNEMCMWETDPTCP